jgi:hypothetical protein
MRILCGLGFHRAEPDPVWNRGYHFSRCRVCGADLVRTAAGRWHVPKGKKVVWKPRSPRGKRPD